MPRTDPGNLLIVVTLWATAHAAAQQTTLDLTPVDQAIEDVSVLSMSLRRIEPGLQRPNDFSEVYRIDGTEDLYVRQQGGLYAVFPQSVYAVNKEGQLQAPIPGGTVFYIGVPPLLASKPPAVPVVDGMIQGRIENGTEEGADPYSDLRRSRGYSTKSGLSPSRLPAIVSDEVYRQQRVHELLRRAAASRSNGTPVQP